MVCSVNSNANALDLKIPENSVCEVRQGKLENTETAVIICGLAKKNSNNLNHMYVSIIRKLVDSYHFYRLSRDTKWRFTSDRAEKKSI